VTGYRLQARRAVEGSAPRREETRLADADTLDDALSAGGELADEGFTVWVFRRTERATLTATPGPLHLVTTLGPATARGPAGRQPAVRDMLAARRR
jgi:hypothetical protein